MHVMYFSPFFFFLKAEALGQWPPYLCLSILPFLLSLFVPSLSIVQGHWGNYQSCTTPDVTAKSNVWNKARWTNITTNPGFVGTGNISKVDDYALRSNSRIYTINPNFKSCPRASVGPTTIAPGTILPIYLQYFNIAQPARFNDMLNFSFSKILDGSLSIPVQSFDISPNTLTVPY